MFIEGNNMRTICFIVITFGLFVAFGGYIGYVNKGSMPSLVMGLSFGISLIVTGAMVGMHSKFGHIASLVLCVILALFFSWRYLSTGKFIPAGVVAIMSLLTTMALIIPLQKNRRG